MEYTDKKGITHILSVGPKGGYYWTDNSGKKHYVKEPKKVSKPTIVEKKPEKIIANKPTLKSYICWFYELDAKTGERIDDFKEWTEAYSKEEARQYFENEHRHSISNGTCEISMICEKR